MVDMCSTECHSSFFFLVDLKPCLSLIKILHWRLSVIKDRHLNQRNDAHITIILTSDSYDPPACDSVFQSRGNCELMQCSSTVCTALNSFEGPVPLSESDSVRCSPTYPMQRYLGRAEKWKEGRSLHSVFPCCF